MGTVAPILNLDDSVPKVGMRVEVQKRKPSTTHWPSGIQTSRHEYVRYLGRYLCRLVEMTDRNVTTNPVRIINVERPGTSAAWHGGGSNVILSRRTQLQARRAKNLFTVSLAIHQSLNT